MQTRSIASSSDGTTLFAEAPAPRSFGAYLASEASYAANADNARFADRGHVGMIPAAFADALAFSLAP